MLPNPGGVLQQNPRHLRRLNATIDELEKWREEEMQKEMDKNK
jgi:hypothetical protein